MNRKGFTLIELLAVIVILGIILTFAVPSITNIYKESKLKTEGMFLNELSKSIDSYVTLNSDKIAFNEKKTATKTENNQSLSVTVYEGKISIKDLIDDQIIEEKDLNEEQKQIKEIILDNKFKYQKLDMKQMNSEKMKMLEEIFDEVV